MTTALELAAAAALAAAYIYITVRVFKDMEARGQPGILWVAALWFVPLVSLIAYVVVKRRYPPTNTT